MVIPDIGPGWIMKDLSEIKPSSFSVMRSLENEYDSLRVADLKKKASTDPMFKYVKRLLPKPREPTFVSNRTKPDLEESYKNPKPRGLYYETSDKGHSLMNNYLQDLSKERVSALSTDVATLKKDLRDAAKKESEEVKSRMNPNSAHKVYAWRGLLEEREPKSHSFSCVQVPSEVYLPDKTKQMISVYHRNHDNHGKVRNVNGYWQIPKLGPTMTRDRNGLRILDNLEMENDIKHSKKSAKDTEYHYCWPLTDTNTGDSIQSWVKE